MIVTSPRIGLALVACLLERQVVRLGLIADPSAEGIEFDIVHCADADRVVLACAEKLDPIGSLKPRACTNENGSLARCRWRLRGLVSSKSKPDRDPWRLVVKLVSRIAGL